MTVQSITPPSHGTTVLNGDGTVTYTPTTGYVGPDSFGYTAIDSNGQTATATVAITVAAMAADDTATGAPNAPSMVSPLTNDTPSAGSTFDPATLRIFDPANSTWGTQVTDSAVGTWKVVGSELQFTPVAGYSGNASVDYRVTDTASNTVSATASVFYPPTLALAYTNVDRAGVGVWAPVDSCSASRSWSSRSSSAITARSAARGTAQRWRDPREEPGRVRPGSSSVSVLEAELVRIVA